MPVSLVKTFPKSLADKDPAATGDPTKGAVIQALLPVLASPDAAAELPAYRMNLSQLEAQAYWEAACYIVFFHLGWANPGAGFKKFYRSKKNDRGDHRLKLLRDVFNSDGQLDALAAWMWVHPEPHHYLSILSQSRTAPYSVSPSPDHVGPKDAGDAASRLAQWPELRPGAPGDNAPAGENTLHIGGCMDDSATHETGVFLQGGVSERRAALILDSAKGWYPELAKRATRLPDVGDNSWYVDVFVRPVGWLGTFRKSRVTGLWFQGKHSVHMMGNQ